LIQDSEFSDVVMGKSDDDLGFPDRSSSFTRRELEIAQELGKNNNSLNHGEMLPNAVPSSC
jgi:hypothetical protein